MRTGSFPDTDGVPRRRSAGRAGLRTLAAALLVALVGSIPASAGAAAPRVALIPFDPGEVNLGTVEFLAEFLRQELSANSTLTVLSASEVEKVVGSRRCFAVRCGVELAARLAVDRVLLGRARKDSGEYLLELSVVDRATADNVLSLTARAATEDGLFLRAGDLLDQLARELSAPVVPAAAPPPTVSPPPPPTTKDRESTGGAPPSVLPPASAPNEAAATNPRPSAPKSADPTESTTKDSEPRVPAQGSVPPAHPPVTSPNVNADGGAPSSSVAADAGTNAEMPTQELIVDGASSGGKRWWLLGGVAAVVGVVAVVAGGGGGGDGGGGDGGGGVPETQLPDPPGHQ